MPARVAAAAAIHFLTASGSIFGLLALHFATDHRWQAVFVCLGIALVIDAIDGPLARRTGVEVVLPRFSGARLDDIVDYLNYCVVPAFILVECGAMPAGIAIIAGAVIVLTSLFHFADRSSKTQDGYFVGFPAIWNIVAFYVFVFDLGAAAVILLVTVFAVLTPVPIKWAHPLRSRYFRPLTLGVVAVWALAAIYTLAAGFPGNLPVQVIFAISALYLFGVGLIRTFHLARAP